MSWRELSEDDRYRLMKAGHALPDRTYPCPDCDAVRDHLKNFHQVSASHRAQLAALLRKRNEELGCGLDLRELDET